MKSFTYVIQDEVGIHARPAGILAKEVKKYSSRITISGNGKSADAGKLMAVMGMGIKKGMEVTVTAEGRRRRYGDCRDREVFQRKLLKSHRGRRANVWK